MIDRRTFLSGATTMALGVTLLPAGRARAAATGRLLYGYPAGAIGDNFANAVLPLLAAHDGPRYELEIIEGRNTRLATTRAKAAPADGSTLLQVLSSSFTLQPQVYKQIDFDPLKDFEPVAGMGDIAFSLTLGPVVPASVVDVASFVNWLRDNPEYRNIGVSIYGTLGHLALRVLAHGSDVPLRGQPYTGSAAMLNDLVHNGLAAAITVAAPSASPDAHRGLRSIGVTSRERLKYWPQVPTLREQGFADLDISGWFGWFAPAGTPASVIEPLRQRIKVLQASAEYRTVQEHLLMTPAALDPEQVRERIRRESQRYGELLKLYPLGRVD